MYLTKLNQKICELFVEDFTDDKEFRFKKKYTRNSKFMLLSPDNVLAIYPLNKKSFDFLVNRVSNVADRWHKNKLENYKDNLKKKLIHSSKYSVNYLVKIIEILKGDFDSVVLNMSSDYPLGLEFIDEEKGLAFEIYLAPRAEE